MMELSDYYVSCTGQLCLTVTQYPFPPIVFIVIGVSRFDFILEKVQ